MILSIVFLITIFILIIAYLILARKIQNNFLDFESKKNELEKLKIQYKTLSIDHNRVSAILANMVEGIISVSANKEIQFYNTKILNIFSIPINPYKGKKIGEIHNLEYIDQLIDEALIAGKIVQKDLKFYLNGEKKALQTHALCFSDGSSKSVIVVVQDVTELHRLEKIRKDFVANVSHELKTPLTAIRGYTETLLEGALDDAENRVNFVEKIKSNADRLLELVQDILQLAKLESGEKAIFISPEDWTPIISEVLSQHEGQIAKKNMQVVFEQSDQSWMVLGEKQSMTQIFVNLFTNAMRYTPDNGKILIYFERSNDHGTVVVEDNGIGIPSKKLPRVFERFYLVDKARSGEVGGSGLGLSIVKHLVQGINGEIEVESEVGVGSQFKVTLPLA